LVLAQFHNVEDYLWKHIDAILLGCLNDETGLVMRVQSTAPCRIKDVTGLTMVCAVVVGYIDETQKQTEEGMVVWEKSNGSLVNHEYDMTALKVET
jgi:hypothetical protein